MISTSDPLTAVHGATIYLHCATIGNPKPVVIWSKAPSLSSNSYLYNNGTLRVWNMQPDDAGFYTCIATNALGSIQQTTLVMYNGMCYYTLSMCTTMKSK